MRLIIRRDVLIVLGMLACLESQRSFQNYCACMRLLLLDEINNKTFRA